MKEKTKVLFLIHTLGGGGAERVLVDMISMFDKKQFEVCLMTVIDTGVYKNQLPSWIEYRTIFKSPFGKEPKQKKDNQAANSGSLMGKGGHIRNVLAHVYRFLWRVLPIDWIYNKYISDSWDVEVAFLEGVCAKLISKAPDSAKKIAWIHTDIINNAKSSKFFSSYAQEFETYDAFDSIVCVSHQVKTNFDRRFPSLCEKSIVIHNVINSAAIVEKSRDMVPDGFKENDRFSICSIGRLAYVKGIDRLINALAELRAANYDFVCYIVGDGPERKAAEKAVYERGLFDNVHFLGYVSNPYPLLAKVDLCVCASRVEGYSTIVTEACILGTPVLTTNCPGMEEQLGTSQFGLIVENSEEGFVRGLLSIFESSDLYSVLKERADEKKRTLLEKNEGIFAVESLLQDDKFRN